MSRLDARRWVLYWLSNPRFCEPPLYADLVRTPGMRKVVEEARLPRLKPKASLAGWQKALTRGSRSDPR
jgi:hypothetical protein